MTFLYCNVNFARSPIKMNKCLIYYLTEYVDTSFFPRRYLFKIETNVLMDCVEYNTQPINITETFILEDTRVSKFSFLT